MRVHTYCKACGYIIKAMKETSSLLQPVQRERHLLRVASEASR